MYAFDDKALTESNRFFRLESRAEDRAAIQHLTGTANRKLVLLSRLLDPSLYGTADFVNAIKRLVLKNKFTEIRIIVADPGLVMRRGHRLVELAMLLSSSIHIRKAGKQYKGFNEEVLIADETAYFYRVNGTRYQAILNFNDQRQSALLLRRFDNIWGEAAPDLSLRRTML